MHRRYHSHDYFAYPSAGEPSANQVNYLGRNVKAKTNCRWRHPFNEEQRTLCDSIKDCINSYAALEGINPNFYNAAVGQCNAQNDFDGIDDFLCDQFGGDVIFNSSGIVRCDFDPVADSPYASPDKAGNQYIVVAIMAALLLFLIVLIARKRRK